MMTDKLYDRWEWLTKKIDGFDIYGCLIKEKPFDGVFVEFDDVKINEDDKSYQFHWRVADNVYGVDTNTDDFDKYLKEIVDQKLVELGVFNNETSVNVGRGTH